jgi:hypothetical protein
MHSDLAVTDFKIIILTIRSLFNFLMIVDVVAMKIFADFYRLKL